MRRLTLCLYVLTIAMNTSQLIGQTQDRYEMCKNYFTDYLMVDCRQLHPNLRVYASTLKNSRGCIPQESIDNVLSWGSVNTSWKCLYIDEDAELCPSSKPFNITAVFTRSNVTLDCKSQTIAHDDTVPGDRPGITFPKMFSLENNQIQNCRIVGHGTNNGIEISREFKGSEYKGENASYLGHSNIYLENVIVDNAKHGIYIGSFNRNNTLNKVTVRNSSLLSVYIDAGSTGSIIRNSLIENNKREDDGGREAIAIDSSSYNIIEDTRFVGNQNAVKLYKNCGEIITSWQSPDRWRRCPVKRQMTASHNIISNNYFEGISGSLSSSVIVASRQGKEIIEADACEDLDGKTGHFRDYASYNQILNNTFVCKAGIAVIINDSNNKVTGNRFIGGEACQAAVRGSSGWWGTDLYFTIDNIEVTNNTIMSSYSESGIDVNSSAGVIQTNNCFGFKNKYCASRGFQFSN